MAIEKVIVPWDNTMFQIEEKHMYTFKKQYSIYDCRTNVKAMFLLASWHCIN